MACGCARGRRARGWGVVGSALPWVAVALVPKCPACFAGWIAVGTGLGVSVAAAGVVRWGLVAMCAASACWLAWRGIGLARRVIERLMKRDRPVLETGRSCC